VVKLVVQGNSPHPVQIVDMGIIEHCTRPLDGSLFSNGANGGTVSELAVVFNLDLPLPVPVNGLMAGSYFSAHAVSLKEGETEIFKVVSDTTRFCSYKLKLTVVDGAKTVTEVASDHGQPFRVTGMVPISHYKAVYIGGKLPSVAAPFVRETP